MKSADIEDLLKRALDLDPGDWPVFLSQACPEDEELRTEILSLLSAVEEDVAKAAEEEHEASVTAPSEPLGRNYGPYRILREVGRGGMGAVYLAVRVDGGIVRRVALKVLPPHLDAPRTTAAFHREQQIMAGLEHPGIARLYDAGSTATGEPFLAMEYVEGEPIDEFCRRGELPLDALLKIFLEVCDAVSYAHRNLIVHRDLKPTNILVTAEGNAKLLDFGIAKLLEESQGEATVTLGPRALTPAYASPEHLLGRRVTTAADIFSLGALLYKLLTGGEPFPRSYEERLKALESGRRPRPPSMAADRSPGKGEVEAEPPAGWPIKGRELAGDLDAVALKAMETEPEERYLSVSELVADIERFRRGLPVAARNQSLADRVGKFVRRHKAAVSMAAALAAGLAITAVSLAFMTVRISSERALAEHQRDRAERVTEFIVDLFRLSDPEIARGEEVTVREVLDQAAESLPQELEQEPEVRAALLSVVGRVYKNLALFDEAEDLLQRAGDEQLALFGADSPDTLATQAALGSVWIEGAEFQRAEDLLKETLSRQIASLGESSPEIVPTLKSLALAQYRLGKLPEAKTSSERALAIIEATGRVEPEAVLSLRHLKAHLLRSEGRLEEAAGAYRTALEDGRRLLGERSTYLTGLMKDLARIEERLDRAGEAERLLLEALEIERTAFPEGHPKLGFTLNGLGGLYRKQGKLEEAEKAIREGLAVRTRVLGPDHPATGVSYAGLGALLVAMNRDEEARGMFHKTLQAWTSAMGPDHVDLAHSHLHLHSLESRAGDLEAAEHHLSEALRVRRLHLDAGHPLRLDTEIEWIRFLAGRGRRAEARDSLEGIRNILAGETQKETLDALRAELSKGPS